jgi:hypothetical protein
MAYILWFSGCVLATPIAAATGANSALSADDVSASTAVVTDAAALREMADELRRAIELAADHIAPGRLQPAGVVADSELRLALSSIVFSGDGEPNGLAYNERPPGSALIITHIFVSGVWSETVRRVSS